MLKRTSWCAILSLLLTAVAAQAQQAQNDAAKRQTTPKGAVPATTDPTYIIGPQDVIDIDVWHETELSRSVPVRPDGKISLPLINDVQAAGFTPTQLSAQITTNLTKYVTNPEVTRPGAYTLIPDMNVLQALSNAGGLTAFANSKKIYVLRRENGKQQKIPF